MFQPKPDSRQCDLLMREFKNLGLVAVLRRTDIGIVVSFPVGAGVLHMLLSEGTLQCKCNISNR